MKHFENIWNAAEELQDKENPQERVNMLVNLLKGYHKDLTQEELEALISRFMFELTGLSKDLNINVAAALRKAIDDKKIDTYG